MNLPNSLTTLRIFFVPLLVVVLLTRQPNWDFGGLPIHFEVWGVLILLVAAATDVMDGYIARKRREVTTLGILLDPIADKLLISAALVSLVDIHRVPAWMVILIIGREFAVSGLRSIASAGGYTIAASDLGKSKMAAQVIAIALVIGSIRWTWLAEPATIGMWAVMLFGIVSAIDYFRTFWRRVDDSVKLRRRRELLRMERRKKRSAMASGQAV